jgi:CRP-like cAMP-binding protein
VAKYTTSFDAVFTAEDNRRTLDGAASSGILEPKLGMRLELCRASREERSLTGAYERFERFMLRWCEFPDAEIAKARAVFEPGGVPRGALLVRAGDPPERVAFIVRGLVRLYAVGLDGTERTYGFRAEDELVCAYSAVLRGETSGMFIQALEPCSLLVASRAGFDELCAGHHSWRVLVARLTESLYVRQERRQAELLFDDATTRYRNFMVEQSALAWRLTQRQIASYVGVTPVALSRIRRTLTSVNDRSGRSL